MSTKYILFLIFLMFASMSTAQQAKWANRIFSEGYNYCNDLVTDSSGNIYVTGQIEYTANFNGSTLYSVGSHDIYVAKYDSAGNLLWARRAGGSDGDIGHAVAVDYLGNVFITGEFESVSDFSGTNVSAQGDNNMFVAKYDASGNFEWVRAFGTNSGNTKGFGIACDSLGNVYATGYATGRVYLSGNSLFSSRGGKDVILVKLSPGGSLIWDEHIGGPESEEGYGVVVKGEALYVTGIIDEDSKFSSSVTLDSDGGKDFFVAKYDLDGDFIWARSGGGSGDDFGRDVTVNVNGEIVCTGDFRYGADFGSMHISSSGNTDVFIVSYDSNGNILWLKKAGGSGIDMGNKISHDFSGNLLLCGSFSNTGHFDTISIVADDEEDAFMAGFDSSGNVLFARGFGGNRTDRGNGIGADKYGNIYFAGDYWTNLTFDSFFIQGDLLFDAFLVRFGEEPVCSSEVEISDATCFNTCNGSANIISTGTPPFIYDWALLPNQHTGIVTGLCVGSYPVSITDSLGCVVSDTIVISQPSKLIISNSVVVDVSCHGCNDGSISIDVSGGVSPYSFAWSDGATTQDRQSLTRGTYEICVTDSNNCIVCDTFVVSGPTTSIEETGNDRISVMMNPADRSLYVRNTSTVDRSLRLSIFQSHGKLVRSEDLLSNSIYVGDLADGFYLIQITDRITGEHYISLPAVISR